MKDIKINAGMIEKLLSVKHRDDIFVPECKNGPTHTAGHLRMDAWVMKRSWANPLTIAYEIKVSRSDFLGDQKWHRYLDYCNEFYFVCPTGLIDPTELPAEAGLMYVAKTGTRLFRKKAAPRRKVQIPESLSKYLPICRMELANKNISTPDNPAAYWKKWLEEKEYEKDLGYLISQTIAREARKIKLENSD